MKTSINAKAFLALLLFLGTSSIDAASISNESRPRSYSRDGNSVDTATGAFLQEVNLVSLQGARLLSLDLSYNSFLVSRKGDTGFGWSHQYEARIVGDPNAVVTVFLDGNIGNQFRFNAAEQSYAPINEQNRYDVLTRFPSGEWQLIRRSGTKLFFQGVLEAGSYHLFAVQDRNFRPITLTRNEGRLTQITEPLAGRDIFLIYKPVGDSLLHYLVHGSVYSFLQYDASSRLSRIYDPVELQTVGSSTADLAIPFGSQGVQYPVVVSSTATDRIIRVRPNITHAQPGTLQAFLISPSGRSVPVNATSRNLFIDDFLGENLSGTWILKVIDAVNDGVNGTINGYTIQASEQPATWVQYDYDVFPYNRITRASDSKGYRLFSNAYDSLGRVVFQDDGRDDNGAWRFKYETLQNGDLMTTVFDRTTAASATEYVHDSEFHLRSTKDALGNTIRNYYNQITGDLEQITDARGNSTRFTYDNEGRGFLTSITKPNGTASRFGYDEEDLTDQDGNQIDGGPRGNLTSVIDALGQKSVFMYDEFNNQVGSSNAKDIEQSKIYDQNGQLIITVNKDGDGMEYGYENGMLTTANIVDGPEEKVEYDSSGRPTKLVDAAGFATTIVYDPRGNILDKRNALGEGVISQFDHRGRRIKEIDQKGSEVLYEYDRNGNVSKITNALLQTTRFTYDGEDRLIRVTNDAGYSKRTVYSEIGQVIQEIDEEGNKMSFTYDENGNKTAIFGPNGVKLSESIYNSLNLPISNTDAQGNTTTFEYNVLGKLIAITDPKGRTTRYVRDSLDRVEKVVDPLSREFQKHFLDDDALDKISDAGNSETSFTYTAKNEVATVTTPFGLVTKLEYTEDGFISRFIPPSVAKQKRYSYNEARRIARVEHAIPGVPDIVNSYDSRGNLVNVSTQASPSDPLVSQTGRTFDDLSRQTSFTDSKNDTVSYQYNSIGLVSRLTYPDGKLLSYSYDAASRLKTITDWAGRVTEYSWNEYNEIESILFPNDTVRVMDYDESGRLMGRSDFDALGSTIVSYTYTYDTAGFITAEHLHAEPATFEPSTSTFGYSLDNRLTQKDGITVTYDSDGNVSAGPVSSQVVTFEWDHNNNLKKAGDINFTSDIDDRLNGWQTPTETVSFTTLDSGGNSQILVAESSSGTTTRYVYGVGLAYEEVDGQIKVHHYDERGNTVRLSDSSGHVSGTIAYSPYGLIISQSGDTETHFKYGGLFGVVTAPNGTNYMRYRWYSPEMRRFLSMDSSIGDIMLPSSLNRYSYAGNNPIIFNDPNGEFVNVLVGAVAGAVIGVTVELVSAGIQGRPVSWNKVGAAALGGLVSGAIAGAGCPPCAALGGAAGAATENLFGAAFSGESVEWESLAFATFVGGAAGGLAGAAGKKISNKATNQYVKRALSPIHIARRTSRTVSRPVNQVHYLKAAFGTFSKSGFSNTPATRSLIAEAFGALPGIVGGVTGSTLSHIVFPPNDSEDEGELPGSTGDNVNGFTSIPTANIGTNGEYSHAAEYQAALNVADLPLPDTRNHLSSF